MNTDLTPTIIAKSDQLNADDLIGRSITVKITEVEASATAEQPVSIHYEGDAGRPYKPGKSMRRVLVQVWGADGSKYVGRSLTLYRDEKVQFGGLPVGGIRISHMSGIDRDITLALTATRGNKRAFTVRPLATTKRTAAVVLGEVEIDLSGAMDRARVDEIVNGEKVQSLSAKGGEQTMARLMEIIAAARARFPDPPNEDDDEFPGDKPMPEDI
jgi:hypothetical protein